MLNALFENRNSSTHAFQCSNVSITGHQFHSKVSREHRDRIMLGSAGDCRPDGLVLRQDS
jgi:hypothetical protein